MKIAVLGGSSPSTMVLLAQLAARRGERGLEVALVARDLAAASSVVDGARLIEPRSSSIEVTLEPFDRVEDAIAGADVVILQIRAGGLAGRRFDETFPLAFGICGDEGLGPGGLAAAWRSWPLLDRIGAALQRVAPQALTILLTSPTSLLVRAMRTRFPLLRVVGICELPLTTLRDACTASGCSIDEVDADYVGTNHAGWFTAITRGGDDLIAAHAARRSPGEFPTAADIAACGNALPTKYLELHYHAERCLQRQRAATIQRARVVMDWRRRLLDAAARGDAARTAATIEERPAPWYSEAVAPLILDLERRAETGDRPYFLSIENRGALVELGADVVVELPHRLVRGELVVMPPRRVPPQVRDVLLELVGYETRAALSVVQREPTLVRAALEAHPWVRGHPQIAELARQITEQSEPAPQPGA